MSSSIESVLQENRIFPPSAATVRNATISGMAAYEALCREARSGLRRLLGRVVRIENISWKQPFTQALDESAAPFYKWFADGKLNVSYNCLDRNVEAGLGDKWPSFSRRTHGRSAR